MANEYENLKKLWDTRFTPVTDEIRELLVMVKNENDGSWDALAREIGIRTRQLRRIRLKHKTVSLRTMDQILARSGYAYRLQTMPWYTVDELVEMGIWGVPLPHSRDPKRFVPDDSEFSLKFDEE
jgi:hypothetical protein